MLLRLQRRGLLGQLGGLFIQRSSTCLCHNLGFHGRGAITLCRAAHALQVCLQLRHVGFPFPSHGVHCRLLLTFAGRRLKLACSSQRLELGGGLLGLAGELGDAGSCRGVVLRRRCRGRAGRGCLWDNLTASGGGQHKAHRIVMRGGCRGASHSRVEVEREQWGAL